MALDVVGFSKMMGENPENTVATLSARRKIVHELINNHKGKVFNEAGDSIVSEFTSSEPAAHCAIQIQTEMARLNMGSAAKRKMLFRIGIHHGDVMDADGNVFGDTVNIAARLEAASSPEGRRARRRQSRMGNLAPGWASAPRRTTRARCRGARRAACGSPPAG